MNENNKIFRLYKECIKDMDLEIALTGGALYCVLLAGIYSAGFVLVMLLGMLFTWLILQVSIKAGKAQARIDQRIKKEGQLNHG